jgi:hypothetical protein
MLYYDNRLRNGEPLAQSVEHRPFKARALGSSPRRLTKLICACIVDFVRGSKDSIPDLEIPKRIL